MNVPHFLWMVFLPFAIVWVVATSLWIIKLNDKLNRLDKIVADHLALDPRYEKQDG